MASSLWKPRPASSDGCHRQHSRPSRPSHCPSRSAALATRWLARYSLTAHLHPTTRHQPHLYARTSPSLTALPLLRRSRSASRGPSGQALPRPRSSLESKFCCRHHSICLYLTDTLPQPTCIPHRSPALLRDHRSLQGLRPSQCASGPSLHRLGRQAHSHLAVHRMSNQLLPNANVNANDTDSL